MIEVQIKVGALIVRDGRVLLIREWSNKKEGYFWNIVKGTYGDVSGESLEECAVRECREEAGYKVNLTGLLHCAVASSSGGSIRVQFNFLGTPEGDPIKISAEDQKERGEDISEGRWFSREEIRTMPVSDFINVRAYEALLSWCEDRPSYPLGVIRWVKE